MADRGEASGGGDAERQEAGHDARLALLRQELTACGLDGFIVPRADEHQGEYVPARAERLAWLTGFTGSAGLAVVLARRRARSRPFKGRARSRPAATSFAI